MFLRYRATTTMSMADFPCQIRNRFGFKCQIEIRHILGNFGVEKVRILMSTFAVVFAVFGCDLMGCLQMQDMLTCVFPDLGGYLSLMAGIQLAWHRLAKERTSKTPNTQPHTPSSSSRMKPYSGHNARHGPRHLKTGE